MPVAGTIDNRERLHPTTSKAKITLNYVRTKGIIKNARSFSVLNVGKKIGYLLGQPIYPRNSDRPFTSDSWTHPTGGQLEDVVFDARGTEFKITTVDGEILLTEYLKTNTEKKLRANSGLYLTFSG